LEGLCGFLQRNSKGRDNGAEECGAHRDRELRTVCAYLSARRDPFGLIKKREREGILLKCHYLSAEFAFPLGFDPAEISNRPLRKTS
jgi:hypothetical protein